MSEAVEKEEIGVEASPALSPGKSVPVDKASYSVDDDGHSRENGDGQGSKKLESVDLELTLFTGSKGQDSDVPSQKYDALIETTVSASDPEGMRSAPVDKGDECKMSETKNGGDANSVPSVAVVSTEEIMENETPILKEKRNLSFKNLFLLDENDEGSDSGTEEDQSAFMKDLKTFFKEKNMEFKPPKFYGEGLNCLKIMQVFEYDRPSGNRLWRAVIRLGGYEKVTSSKLWRQVGESFRPPRTCTTVAWTFRGFYEKFLLDYEKAKIHGGELNEVYLELPYQAASLLSIVEKYATYVQSSGSNGARRDSAERAMQGCSSQHILSSGELKSINSLKRKKTSNSKNAVDASKSRCTESSTKVNVLINDIGTPADWVKINVQRSKDYFEVYALVPGLLREEVRVQLDPAGRVIITGEPENLNNHWGVTPFKKVLHLPLRIDPRNTSAVVTLHGQLYVRVPFEQPEP